LSLNIKIRGDQVAVRKEEQHGGLEVRKFSGRSGNVRGLETVSNQAPITMLDVVIKNNEGASFTQEIPAGQEGFVLILSGQRSFGKDNSNTFTEDLA